LLPATLAFTRCLVVDDDPELLQSVAVYLRRFGFEVAAAALRQRPETANLAEFVQTDIPICSDTT
jgi:DNA-binding response OmpR family regulator